MKNHVNKLVYTPETVSQLQVLVFKGKTVDDNYPYRTTRDYLGILSLDSEICQQ